MAPVARMASTRKLALRQSQSGAPRLTTPYAKGCWPMRVIFSRKGVDTAAGRCASALIGDRPVSLPIPTTYPTPTTYGQLSPELSSLCRDLSGGMLAGDVPCHLDPDLDPAALPGDRPEGWRGALGQVGAALGHLNNQGVGPGDLFLFWGLYRPVTEADGHWGYVGPQHHAIHAMFGWLHIENVCPVNNDGADLLRQYPWLVSHPHATVGVPDQAVVWPAANVVYVASEKFSIAGHEFPGSGVFRKAFRLTAENQNQTSIWSIPAWLDVNAGGVGLTYHPANGGRWLDNGMLHSAAPGQEFVADINGRNDAETWIATLLENHR